MFTKHKEKSKPRYAWLFYFCGTQTEGMDLFNQAVNETTNLLPKDGTVHYYGKLFDRPAADRYLEVLLNTIEWRNDEAVIFGKKIVTKRKVAWYGEQRF